MKWLRVLRARMTGAFRKAQFEREIEEELRFHLRMRAQEQMAHGLSPLDAHAEATRSFGNIQLI